MAWIVGIVIFILIFVFGFVAYFCFESEKPIGGLVGTLLTIGAVIAFIIVPFSFHQIDTGEIAIVKQYGKVVDTRSAGLNFDLWFIRTYEKYDLKTQETTQEIAAYSSSSV